MCSPTAIVMGGTALLGIGAGKKASKEAKKARKAQEAAGATAASIAQDQLKFQRELWTYYKTEYQPLEKQMIQEAGVPGEVLGDRYASEAGADVAQAFDKSRDIFTRSMAKFGIAIGPEFAGIEREALTKRATEEAAARTRGRRLGEDTSFARKVAAVSAGRNLPGAAAAAGQTAVGAASVSAQAARGLGDTAQGQADAMSQLVAGLDYSALARLATPSTPTTTAASGGGGYVPYRNTGSQPVDWT